MHAGLMSEMSHYPKPLIDADMHADGAPGRSDLAAHMAARNVARYKYPEAVLLVGVIPMTPGGKIRREALPPLAKEACGR